MCVFCKFCVLCCLVLFTFIFNTFVTSESKYIVMMIEKNKKTGGVSLSDVLYVILSDVLYVTLSDVLYVTLSDVL